VTDESPATPEPGQQPAARQPAARPPRQQRRARKIAMGPAEVDAFLAEQRTCRVATASELGPYLTPLWYLWDGTALWLTSIVSSQRLDEPERLFARKYAGGDVMHHDGRHAWLRLVPDKVTSWDFRILHQAQN
jgi:hypothetical protein